MHRAGYAKQQQRSHVGHNIESDSNAEYYLVHENACEARTMLSEASIIFVVYMVFQIWGAEHV